MSFDFVYAVGMTRYRICFTHQYSTEKWPYYRIKNLNSTKIKKKKKPKKKYKKKKDVFKRH